MTIKTYAISRSETTEWNAFVDQNDWATQALNAEKWDNKEDIPSKCIAIYYVVDKNEKTITNKLYVTTYDPIYKQDFKKINLHWIEKYFTVEPSDIHQLDHPEENILQPGGEMFFLVENNQVVGTVVMVMKHGQCELGKLAIVDHLQSKGYSHPLMKEAIQWAKDKKLPDILILCSTLLAAPVRLYRKYGFETIYEGKHPDYDRCDLVMKLTF
ncbi:acyl-CoA N-acyltransferase [Cunninghamella echinulata]|nr:acyl-CoA N-acyltransferase [Cunninghamella echinulata]